MHGAPGGGSVPSRRENRRDGKNKRLHPRLPGLITWSRANTPPLIVFVGFYPGTWRFSQNLPLLRRPFGDVTDFPLALFGILAPLISFPRQVN